MKRILSFFVLASVLLASSCSLKEDFKGNDSEFATISLTLGGPESSATRAIGDGKTVDFLHYAVYDADDKLISALGEAGEVTFPTEVDITLAKGQTYKIAFWAQNKSTDAYKIIDGDVRHVEIDYADYNNNDESRDAFFKTIEHTVTGDIALNVVLERPFAQINLGVTEEDWNDAKVAGIEVAKSKVVISEAATGLDLFDGTVSGRTSVEYQLQEIPSEFLYVDLDKNEVKEAYRYLSMSYILVNAADKGLVNALFTLDTDKEDVEVKVDNLPVQRNWRTNIIGRMLTGDITFNIDIDPIFDGEEIYPDTLEEELLFAAANGGEVTLTQNVEVDYISAEGNFELNIEENVTLTSGSPANYAVIVRDGKTVINSDGEINALGGGIGVINGAEVIYNGGTLEVNTESTSQRYNFYAQDQGSSITINGGEFSFSSTLNQKRAYVYAGVGTTVYINGGNFGKASSRSGYTDGIYGDGEIIITGGSFGFNPSSRWVKDGYKVIVKDGKYYVVENDVDAVAGNTEDLQESLDNGQDVVLTDDIAVERTEAGSNGYGATGISQLNGGVIDGNGNDISVDAWGTWDSAINTTGGTIKNLNVTGGMRGIFVNHNSSYSDKVILENVTIDGTVYTISCDQGTNKGLEAYNSTFNGWTSYAATIGDVKFVDCSFGEGQGYAYCRPYAPTEFVNCAFEAGYELDARAAVTFENCTIGGVALTADNLSTLVTSNIANASVK